MNQDLSYVIHNHKKLRCGYTTGTCAAAASKSACRMLLGGEKQDRVSLMTPAGIRLTLDCLDIRIEEAEDGNIRSVTCAIRKDGGDDIDATHNALIYATVSKSERPGVQIDGGTGVGRVTRPGLDQPVGNAAINRVPRQMIRENVEEVCREMGYAGGISVLIFVPEGEEIAGKTFNPRLGIVGGISILGTSGIVRPMSEKALIDTIRVEMKMQVENGGDYILITPGNYGERFAQEMPGLSLAHEMKCSNFIGETVDMAVDLGVKGLLFISHIGKFIKVSGGIMNTHSHEADCRAELIASAVLLAGGDADLCRGILATNTTEDSLKLLKEEGAEYFDPAMQQIADRIAYYLEVRAQGRIKTGAIVFSNIYGKLAQTANAEELIELLNAQGRA